MATFTFIHRDTGAVLCTVDSKHRKDAIESAYDRGLIPRKGVPFRVTSSDHAKAMKEAKQAKAERRALNRGNAIRRAALKAQQRLSKKGKKKTQSQDSSAPARGPTKPPINAGKK